MDKKTKKYLWYGIILVVIVYITYLIMAKPSYPAIYTPKDVWGNPNASVTVIEFSDFQCPACGAAYPVIKNIKKEFSDRIAFKYYHFPLTSIHPFAFKAAEASECANDQHKFWDYHNRLFEDRDLTRKHLKQIAADLGLDTKSFNSCLDSGAKKTLVESDMREGSSRGVQGTPTIFVNGKKVDSWNYQNLKDAITFELKRKQA